MAMRPEDLTVDYKKLLRMTVHDRISMARSPMGQSYLGSLTPTQYAQLFPSYYKDMVPSYSAVQQATTMGGGGGAGAYPSSAVSAASSIPSGPAATTGPTPSSAVKPGWLTRLEKNVLSKLPSQSGGISAATTTAMNASAYSPQKGGSKMEGGYAASRKGPDGQATVRTLADYAAGRSQHITLAGNPSQYGKEYIIPKISFYDKNGELKTLTNVRAVVHDTGSAFKKAADNRFDIPVDQDASNAIMAKNHSLWKEQGVQFGPPSIPQKPSPEATRIQKQEVPEDDAAETGLGPTKKQQRVGPNIVDRTKDFKGYGSKSESKPYKFIGVHYTGGSSLDGALSVAKAKNVGYQYLIDRDGTVHMVQNPDEGRSNHWGKNNIHPEAKNNNSVGISFVGVGNKDITEAQRKAGLELIEQQRQRYGIVPENVLGHGETTQNHREDNEGYGLLEPFRQMHGLTPETGKMPNIASEGGVKAWKKGNYNYNLDSLQELKQSEAAPSLPEGLGPEVMSYYATLKTAQEKAAFADTINKAVSLGYGVDKINQEAAAESQSTGKIETVVENIEGLKFVSPLDSWKQEDLMNVKSEVGETRQGMRRGFMADRSFRSGGRTKRLHAGVDYFAPAGSPVKSAENGVVIRAEKQQGYNGTVDVLHTAPDGKQYVVRYGHLNDSFPIKVGQQIQAGTVIGSLDGDAHLHMEVRDYEKYKSVGEFAKPTPGMTREDAEKLGLYDPADYFAGKGRFGHMVQRAVVEPTPEDVMPEPTLGPTESLEDTSLKDRAITTYAGIEPSTAASPTLTVTPTPTVPTTTPTPTAPAAPTQITPTQDQIASQFTDADKAELAKTPGGMPAYDFWKRKEQEYVARNVLPTDTPEQQAAPAQQQQPSATPTPEQAAPAPEQTAEPAEEQPKAMSVGGLVNVPPGEDIAGVNMKTGKTEFYANSREGVTQLKIDPATLVNQDSQQEAIQTAIDTYDERQQTNQKSASDNKMIQQSAPRGHDRIGNDMTNLRLPSPSEMRHLAQTKSDPYRSGTNFNL